MNKSARMLLPFLVLVFVVMGCFSQAEIDARKERDRVIEVLNKQFDLRDRVREAAGLRSYDCKFKFESGDEDGKTTLVVYFCESTSKATKERKLGEVLIGGNVDLIKNAGFEQVKLYERVTYELVDQVAIR
jgi:hypothetical protein